MRGTKKTIRRAEALRLLGLVALAVTFGNVLHAQQETITNGVYTVEVQTSGSSAGSWNARLGPHHSAFDTGQQPQDILFTAGRTSTNFSTLRIYDDDGDEHDYPVAGERGGAGSLDNFSPAHGPSPYAPAGQGVRTSWQVKPADATEHLAITQDVFLVGSTVEGAAIYHVVEITNEGPLPVRVGWRNLYDWSFGGGAFDAPVNSFETRCGQAAVTVSDQEALAPAGTDVVRLSLANRDYEILLGLEADPALAPVAVTPPDRHAFVHWPRAKDSAFDYAVGSSPVVTDSAGVSWFGPDATTARTIAPRGSVRFTQVLFALLEGGCVAACADIRYRDETLCATDGSSDFTLDLMVENLTADEIHHLFVFDQDPESRIEIVGDSVSFPAAFGAPLGAVGSTLPPSSRPVKLRIRGAEPGETLSLLFTFHDETLEMCCSRELAVQVPECDCAQVRDLTTCPAFAADRPRSFTFTLDNLAETAVSHVYLTPVDPPDARFTPNHFRVPTDFLAALPQGGSAGPFTVTVDGPGVEPGSEVEFLVSLHDTSFRECCPAQKRRVSLPAACPGVSCQGVGGASTLFSFGNLVVGDIGFADNDYVDGFHCAYNNFPHYLDVSWRTLRPVPGDGASTGFEVVTEGTTGGGGAVQELGTLRTELDGGELVVGADLQAVGSTTQRVEVYRQGDLAAVVTGNTAPVRVAPREDLLWPRGFGKLGFPGQPTCYVLEWDDLVGLEIAGQEPIAGDELRILAENASETVTGVESFTMRASGIPQVVVTHADALFDCNRNGVPDSADLAAGSSEDADADGVPDECGARGALRLNTGFDQATGTVLPAGAADAGWRVVDPQPERPAAVVGDPVGSWPAPLPDSRWISLDAQSGRSVDGVQRFTLERCFCLADTTSQPRLDLRLWSDDRATVLLNGVEIAAPGGRFDGPPLAVTVAEPAAFRVGENCLSVVVEDSGAVVTGLDLAGTVTGGAAACVLP